MYQRLSGLSNNEVSTPAVKSDKLPTEMLQVVITLNEGFKNTSLLNLKFDSPADCQAAVMRLTNIMEEFRKNEGKLPALTGNPNISALGNVVASFFTGAFAGSGIGYIIGQKR